MTNPNISNQPESMTSATMVKVGQTALEVFARPVEEYMQPGEIDDHRPLRSTPTQQRTWDPVRNHPGSVPDISQE